MMPIRVKVQRSVLSPVVRVGAVLAGQKIVAGQARVKLLAVFETATRMVWPSFVFEKVKVLLAESVFEKVCELDQSMLSAGTAVEGKARSGAALETFGQGIWLSARFSVAALRLRVDPDSKVTTTPLLIASVPVRIWEAASIVQFLQGVSANDE